MKIKPDTEEQARIKHHKLMQKKIHRIDEVRALAKSILEKRKKHGDHCECGRCTKSRKD